jgi:hypothetical protein
METIAEIILIILLAARAAMSPTPAPKAPVTPTPSVQSECCDNPPAPECPPSCGN